MGEPVRFNGDHKRRNPHIEKLSQHLTLQSICPEVGIGLPVPREPIRLVDQGANQATPLRLMDSNTQTIDYTEAIEAFADSTQGAYPFCGYILVKGSPSCGLERVKRYSAKGKLIASDASGLFTKRLQQNDPLLPLEEDGRLYDHGLRESFISRVYLYHDWRLFRQQTLTASSLLAFYSQYKYLVMAHSVSHYQELGKLLANLKNEELETIAQRLIEGMMVSLKKVATPASHTNVLQHLQGYLKNKIDSQQKRELSKVIDDYRRGIVPLITPLTLLQHHFNRTPDPYIEKQTFMAPYPSELALRSVIPSY